MPGAMAEDHDSGVAPEPEGTDPGPRRPELYVSTDVETDGPIPGPNSMLSLASAVFSRDGRVLSTWTANLLPLPGSGPDAATSSFWAEFPEAYAATQRDRRDPAEAMPDYARWLGSLDGEPVFVAYPAGFDFTWVFWYLHRFAGGSPFSYSAIDMRTYAMAVLGRKFRHAGKGMWPRHWFSDAHPHTHVALDDALEQGHQFIAMLDERAKKR